MPRPVRVAAFVDGFNLYHAIHNLGRNHLKWLDLFALCKNFAPEPANKIQAVYYFSAFATWRGRSYRRHQKYVAALRAAGVTVVLGAFKEKQQGCRRCGYTWLKHEEKETDVNLALYLLKGAFQDEFDRALVVSQDSDLAPAITMVRSVFTNKPVHVLTPIGLSPSYELIRAAGKGSRRLIKNIHVERSLLPAEVRDSSGRIIADRPKEYDPPTAPEMTD